MRSRVRVYMKKVFALTFPLHRRRASSNSFRNLLSAWFNVDALNNLLNIFNSQFFLWHFELDTFFCFIIAFSKAAVFLMASVIVDKVKQTPSKLWYKF